MRERFLILLFVAGWVSVPAGGWLNFCLPAAAQQNAENATPEPDVNHLRLETEHGPLHLWRPAKYDPRTAGTVIYIHGYFTSVDQAWTGAQLDRQFRDSGRNALFIAIEAPQSNEEEVSWNSIEDLLGTLEDLAPFPLPQGPLVVVGHSGAYRTMLSWLRDPRVQCLILLDGLYGGQAEFRYWLRSHPQAKPHRMLLVSSDTWRQSNRFARRVSGTARRRRIPAKASTFTPRETRARLLYLRSQFDHDEIISSGKVIPVLLQITPIRPLAIEKPRPSKALVHKPSALDR